MKKKGLIVATIVMVLVLAVSLTTATYAWFTNSGSAKVDPISFAVSSAADVLIGVSETNEYVDTPSASDFWADTTVWNTAQGKWSGDTNGLGLSVSTGTDLSNMQKAVYSFTSTETVHVNEYFKESTSGTTGAQTGAAWEDAGYVAVGTGFTSGTYYVKQDTQTGADVTAYTAAKDYLNGTMDAYDTNPTTAGAQTANTAADLKGLMNGETPAPTGLQIASGHTIAKAAGNGNSITSGTLNNAVNFSDYLDISFGAAAATSDVMAFGCMVYVSPQDSKATLGLNAAIHVLYNVNNEGWHEYDVYGTNGYDKRKDTMDAPDAPTLTLGAKTKAYQGSTALGSKKEGDAAVWIPLAAVVEDTATLTQDAIEQVRIIIYICGPDADCITSATGVSATISVEFLSINKGYWNQA